MEKSALKLKSYEIPDNLDGAKDLCRELADEVEMTHAYYRQQIAFIKQQYQIALRSLRPDIVSAAALRGMFDEADVTVDPKVETQVEDDDTPAPNPKKKKKKKSAIPDHLPRQVVEHDVGPPTSGKGRTNTEEIWWDEAARCADRGR